MVHTPDDLEEARRARGWSGFGIRALLFWVVLLPTIIVVIDVLNPRETRLVFLLAILPAFISSRGTVRQTVFAALWTPLLITVPSIVDPTQRSVSTGTVIFFSLVLGGWSVLACRQRIDRETRILRLRSASAALQRQILRPLPLRTDQLVVDGLYEPMEEDSMVGGDVYDVVTSPYGSRVLIADVQGKGLRAIGTALAVLGAFREAAYLRPDITDVVDALESAVVRHNDFARQAGEQERFVTALVLDVGDGCEARAVNCGHLPLYVLDGERTGTVLRHEPGVPLGLGSLTPEPRGAERFDFPAGVTFLLCTDGVTEARAPSGAFYPLADRLRAWQEVAPDQVARTLHAELQRHTEGRRRDDIAVLVLRRGPHGRPGLDGGRLPDRVSGAAGEAAHVKGHRPGEPAGGLSHGAGASDAPERSARPGSTRHGITRRSTARTRAGAGGAGSGPVRSRACRRSRSGSGPR